MHNTTQTDTEERLPLKDLELQILLALADGERHGWSIVKELQERRGGRKRILPGSFYRTLNGMLSSGLIEEAEQPPDSENTGPRRKYFKLTDLGIAVCSAEVNRMEDLVVLARSKQLLSAAPARLK